MKYIRLKILKNTCKFKSLPADQWLTKPGQQQETSRLDHEAKKLQDLNKAGHDFQWNGLPGWDESNPSTYGLIFWKKCDVKAHGLGPSDVQTFRDQFANLLKPVRQLQIGLQILTLPTQYP